MYETLIGNVLGTTGIFTWIYVNSNNTQAFLGLLENIFLRRPRNTWTLLSFTQVIMQNASFVFKNGLCLPCTKGECRFMGFHADLGKPPPVGDEESVSFYLDTGDSQPFCSKSTFVGSDVGSAAIFKMPSIPYKGHWQTTQTQIRRRIKTASHQDLHCL